MGKKKPPLALALDQLFDVGGVMEANGTGSEFLLYLLLSSAGFRA
jgi:hypothetical protein